jgi:hypothetical protein
MSASKKPVRARKANPDVSGELPSLTLEKAYTGVARNYYCYDVGMLRAGLTSFSNVLFDLERIEVQFSSSRGANRISHVGKGGRS